MLLQEADQLQLDGKGQACRGRSEVRPSLAWCGFGIRDKCIALWEELGVYKDLILVSSTAVGAPQGTEERRGCEHVHQCGSQSLVSCQAENRKAKKAGNLQKAEQTKRAFTDCQYDVKARMEHTSRHVPLFLERDIPRISY